MTEKLIELRQRFRGYQPVRTEEEDSSGDDDGDNLSSAHSERNRNRKNSIGSSIRQSMSTITNDRAKPSNYFCKYIILHTYEFSIIF